MSNDWELTWNGKAIGKMAAKRLKVNAERVARMLESEVVKSLSVGQPVKRMSSGSMRGLDPSAPGDPPKLVTGRLRASIDHRVDKSRRYVDVYISAGTNYAKVLEYGGKSGKATIAPRPFLRPVLKKHRVKAIKMLTRDIFKRQGISDRRRHTT
jgi:phage gpG-like protein